MTKEEFVSRFQESCKDSLLFKNKEVYTVNELLFILANNKEIGIPDFFCVSIGNTLIPCLDAFVNVETRAIKFNINSIEYDEEIDPNALTIAKRPVKFGALTIHPL